MKLQRGDKKRIADMTGCSLDYVRRVLDGDRAMNSRLAQKIVLAADIILTSREYARQQLQEVI